MPVQDHHLQVQSHADGTSSRHRCGVGARDGPWIFLRQEGESGSGSVSTRNQSHVDDLNQCCSVRVVIENGGRHLLHFSQRTTRNSREFAGQVFNRGILLIKSHKAFVLGKCVLHVVVRPFVMVLDRFDSEWSILVLSADQSPLWRNLHFEHEPVIGCDNRQQVIVGKVDIVLSLDERVNLAKIHP